MGYLTVGLAYLVLYAVAGWALQSHPFARSIVGNIGVALPAVAVIVVILRRRRQWAGCQRLFWDTIAIGMTLWAVGHAGWVFDGMVRQQPTWVHWHTVFSLCGGICPLIALIARPHRGIRSESVPTIGFDLASYGLLAVFIYAYFVLVPSLGSSEGNAEVTLFTLVQVNRLLLFVGMIWFAWRTRHSDWGATYSRFAIGVGVGFFARILTSFAIVRGTYQSGTLIYDMAWLFPWICYGWAATKAPASASPEHRVEVPSPASSPLLGAIPVFVIPLIGYAVLQGDSIGAAGDSFRGLLTSVVTVAGLGLVTLRLASQGGELQRADARLKLLAAATEQTRDLILIIGAKGQFEHANEAFLRAVGYTRAELASIRVDDLMERGFQKIGDHIVAQVREHGVWRGTLLRRRRDGSTFPASCTVVALKDGADRITHYVGVERDITEELALRDQLVHTERLSAVGELVAGVSHEINNPLQTIIGAVELMLEEPPGPNSRRDLELIRQEATRAGQIVRNLLAFVRRTTPDRASEDLSQIVRATVALREYHLQQRNISVILRCDSAPLPVLVNREEIQQVILNLLLNAEQAISAAGSNPASPGSGTIVIQTSQAGRYNIVEVSDDGPGIGAEIRGRIFEPFFTTKEVGEGTGLGLSISHGIASAHGGSLELCPSPRGACFKLSLPAHAARVARDTATRHPGAATQAPRALVIDDEEPIRELLVRLLGRRGYQVACAESGEKALAMAAKQPPSLVVCDVRMPGLGGFEIFRLMTTERHGLGRRFIFITGDATAMEHAEQDVASVPVLAKPFTAADLDAVLARLGTAGQRHPLNSDR